MSEQGSNRLPTRQEIPDEMKWRLEDIYANDDLWSQDYHWVTEKLPVLGEFAGQLGTSGQVLLDCLRLRDQILEKFERLYVYARMRQDEDNTDPKYQALVDRAETLGVQVGSQTAFVEPEILGIPTETLREFVEGTTGLDLYRHYLENIQRMRDHTLPVEQERLLAEASEMGQAPSNIFSMFNNADIQFPTIRDESGQEVELTKGRFIQFMESKDRRVRIDAFKALYSTYGAWRNSLAAMLAANVKRFAFFARTRKYNFPLEAALHGDNIEVSVYDNLINAVHENLPALHRYVRLRRRLLEVDELHMYDLYTPIVADVDMEIPYPEAKSTVITGLEPLGEDYIANLKEGLENHWIDVMENRGKTSGAYSWGAYGTHPYVLLNWQDTLDNMFTLAHEMGHALHSHYSDTNQPYIYAQYPIFLAEVASTVNESLLMHHLLNTVTERNQRRYLINHYLEQFRGTVYRQTMFAEFEKEIHQRVWAGEPLTPQVLCDSYRRLNEVYYGPDIVVDPEIEMEWARIPHFYTPFYVYKYATGFSAATALSQRILDEGEETVERYLTFLKAGGSDYPLNILRRAGVDMTTPEPIQAALRVFAQLVEELETL
ncbi:MAG: oligoendopeptidase F [Firmicutes bacterium]|nr:oligoendopeptidase F [Bacillota bacterium]